MAIEIILLTGKI